MPGSHHLSGSGSMSYKDALQRQMPKTGPGNAATPRNDRMNNLKASLHSIILMHPEGVPLSRVRRSCPLLQDPDLLEGFASCKQLLASLTDVVKLQGYGVQTQVCPAVAPQT